MRAELEGEEQFGPYVVYERLGVGGMATVHRALEQGIEGFERMVALKRLLPHLAEDASFIKSFVREAKLASLLNHVNIVQIFELGRVGTEYFISMEYIDGKDIRRILRHARKVSGPPPINITVGILLQLCDALDYAHTKTDEHGQPLQLVHRDVSPSNVLVTSAGQVKVIDFGIAKAQSSQLRTQTGRVKGKLAYMAPEAIAGKDLDARSDLFAFGVIAHELLTARPLFASKNEYQTLLKVQRGDIMPPSTFNPSCTPDLDALVLRALARDPDERYFAATELRDDLLNMRRRYNLQTSDADIAAWVEHAFSLDVPSEAELSAGQRAPTPRPRPEDDEAVDIAWGGGDEVSNVGPVVLDDVPDVSEKHMGSTLRIAKAIDDAIDDEIGDDVPTPFPTRRKRPTAAPLREETVPDNPPPSQSGKPRPRAGTSPGHTPAAAAPSSGVRNPRLQTQTTDPDGQSLLDAIEIEVEVPDDTILAKPADVPVPPREPVVRFRESVAPPMGQPIKTVQTKPGYSPAKAPVLAAPAVAAAEVDDAAATMTRDSRPAIKPHPAGKPLIDRKRGGPNKTWILVAAVFAAGGIATAVTLFLTRGDDTVVTTPEPKPLPVPRPVIPKTSGTVKFSLEPPDAEVWIEGTLVHSGSPWSTELDPGAYQIQIQRTGFSAWLTTLELSAQETQVMRVVLQPLADESDIAEATLKVTSSPPGLEAVLDGIVLPTRTPIDMPLRVGAHSIVLRQDGVEVWREDLVAQATVSYEFSPSMNADKQRERALRRRRDAAKIPTPAPAPPIASPTIAPVEAPKSGSAAVPPATVPAPTKPVPPPPAPAAAKVITVAPSAVTKISGAAPEILEHKHADLPASAAAKVCISDAGKVTTVDVITKLDTRIAADITRALEGWRYAPYTLDGTPTAACFVVSFKLK